mgnify:CR=1 FL=1
MRLSAMRYKSYTWPHNPRTYTIQYERKMAVHKVPFGQYQLQDLGMTRRVMKGEGEFVGEGAYDEFKKLASVFYDSGPGTLVHPVWQTAEAYFVDLSLAQEPRANYVRYQFTFWESVNLYSGALREQSAASQGQGAQTAEAAEGLWHTVKKGETLWGIARQYGVELTQLIALNTQMKNPNLILPGEQVRIR